MLSVKQRHKELNKTHWYFLQQQSSSSSSNRFIEHDVSTRKLGPSSGIRPSFLNRSIYTFFVALPWCCYASPEIFFFRMKSQMQPLDGALQVNPITHFLLLFNTFFLPISFATTGVRGSLCRKHYRAQRDKTKQSAATVIQAGKKIKFGLGLSLRSHVHVAVATQNKE